MLDRSSSRSLGVIVRVKFASAASALRRWRVLWLGVLAGVIGAEVGDQLRLYAAHCQFPSAQDVLELCNHPASRKTQDFLGFRVNHALRLLAFLFEKSIVDFSFC